MGARKIEHGYRNKSFSQLDEIPTPTWGPCETDFDSWGGSRISQKEVQ